MARERNTLEKIVAKFKATHGDKYDYSKVDYQGVGKNVLIRCIKHNHEFNQTPDNHIAGKGCPLCAAEKRASGTKLDKQKFLDRCAVVHNNKYDYSKADYVKLGLPITIGCPTHGWFQQSAGGHLFGSGCPECGKYSGNTTRTLDSFIKYANKLHKDAYDYSLVDFKNVKVPVKIICKEHGVFEQLPKIHLRGRGCPKCGVEKTRVSQENYIARAKAKHGDKYDYSKTIYRGNLHNVIITCPVHGEFEQQASGHLQYGCVKCAMDADRKTPEEFIKEARNQYGDLYDLSRVKYINNYTPVTIGCKVHGYIKKIPYDFLRGHGCPICTSSKQEQAVYKWLKDRNFIFDKEMTIPGTRYRFDFNIPALSLVIECDGIQHYVDDHYFSRNKDLKANDIIKADLAKQLNLSLERISYVYGERIDNVMEEIISKYVKYERDGLYFRTFEQFVKYFNLPGDATPLTIKQYEYKPRLNRSPL